MLGDFVRRMAWIAAQAPIICYRLLGSVTSQYWPYNSFCHDFLPFGSFLLLKVLCQEVLMFCLNRWHTVQYKIDKVFSFEVRVIVKK